LTSIQSPKEPKKNTLTETITATQKHQRNFLTKIDDGGGKIKLQKAPAKCKPKTFPSLLDQD
jgi:hypothetical protein